MSAHNVNYYAKQLKHVFEGSKYSVYNKINLLMSGFRGKASQKEINALKKAILDEATKKVKQLDEL